MKLWILRPIDEHKKPWGDPWYDNKAYGFIVRAETEQEARALAGGKYEGGNEKPEAWLSSDFSTCVELSDEGGKGIIMRDFRDG